MTTVTIYGASDDLIEVDGDAPGCGAMAGKADEDMGIKSKVRR